jgi:diguanylate cyclase (GGDEF)-like protein/PAS domain S-box-containing protein
MSLAATVAPILTHLVPILYFIYLLVDILSRNRKRIEYLLVSGIVACCLSLFLEEFVRHYLPIEYSPILTSAWFSVSGITIVGLGLHLFTRLTDMAHKLPGFVYPYLFYLPTLLVVLNLLFNDEMVSGSAFHQTELWKLPVYNSAYYIAMFGSNAFNVVYILILWRGIANTGQRELRAIYRELIYGVLVTMFFNLTIGVIDFKGYLPPYPYIYGTLMWCVFLQRTMRRYEFLNHEEVHLSQLFNVSPVAIVLTDLEGNVREANPAARKLFEVLKVHPRSIGNLLQGELLIRIQHRLPIQDVAMTVSSGDTRTELVIDGDYISVEYKPHLILILRDVTAQMAKEQELMFMAYHDMLTKLPNRKFFFDRFESALAEARDTGERLAVLMFDLDRFKEINDHYGHLVGDQALVQVADSIRAILTEEDFAARLGGDEFIIFCRNASKERVTEKIEQLRTHLAEHPLVVDEKAHPLQISIGVSFYPEHGQDSDTLVNHADKAMYEVKRRGRGDYAFATGDG